MKVWFFQREKSLVSKTVLVAVRVRGSPAMPPPGTLDGRMRPRVSRSLRDRLDCNSPKPRRQLCDSTSSS
ncbi:hypothetical protein D3C72_2310130 [compost metagenome]